MLFFNKNPLNGQDIYACLLKTPNGIFRRTNNWFIHHVERCIDQHGTSGKFVKRTDKPVE